MGYSRATELLAAAGVTVLPGDVPPAPPPLVMVSVLVSCRSEDGRTDAWVDGWVHEENPDLVERANAGWFGLATEHGLFGTDREFLLGVPDDDGGRVLGWRRVRLRGEWDLVGAGAELLGSGAGRPEMTMSSLDGTVVMRISTYQSGVSSIVIAQPWRAPRLRGFMERLVELAARPDQAGVAERSAADEWVRYVALHS
ncbi:MAG TPA: hypothetical protein VFW65_06535 [Pseudonocardiaceae bacterium]|nr:hypothetical protein [Pseudonocardiaceae bacterium]